MAEQYFIGCNYHTTWQADKAMRFILVSIRAGRVQLGTRYGSKNFWTDVEDLIFITTKHNIEK